MKKRNLVISLATLGAVAAIGSSVALYSVIDEALTIGIGIRTTSDVKYAISEVVDSNGEVSLSPNQSKHYDFNIQGVKQEGTTFAQRYVLANLKITLTVDTNVAEDSLALANSLEVTSKIGYKAETYWNTNAGLNTLVFGEATQGTGTEATITGSLNAYIYVSDTASFTELYTDHNDVDLDISFSEEAKAGLNFDADFVSKYSEATYTIDIALNEGSDSYNQAYVRNSLSGWTSTDEYEMVANIESNKWEWMWSGTMPTGTEFKCYRYEPNNVEGSKDVWSAPGTGNNTFNEGTTLLYWDGNSGGEVQQQ